MTQLADINAERALVGSCLLSPAIIPDVMGAIGQEEFFFPPYRLMYAAIADLSLDDEPVSPATVTARLSTVRVGYEKALEIVGGSAVVTSALEGADEHEWAFWAKRVRQLNRLRNLTKVAEDAVKLAGQEPEDVDAAFAKVEEELAHAAFRVTSDHAVRVGSDDLSARIQKYLDDPDAISGLETGWSEFDRMLDGLEPGNTSIVYAPTSQFKSLFVQNIGYRLAANNYPGLWFTTEMPRVQVEERILQIDTGLNLRWLRQNHTLYPHKQALVSAVRNLSGMPVTIIDKTNLDVGRLRAEVSRHQKWSGVQYVVVDLVDHVSSRRHRDDETANQSAVMIAMKDIAKSCGVHIMMTKHIVKRQKEDRKRAFYEAEEMKGSSSFSQDVDTAMSLSVIDWGDDGKPRGLSTEEIAQAKRDNGTLTLQAWVTKSRGGDTGPLQFTVNLREGGRIYPAHKLAWVQAQLSA